MALRAATLAAGVVAAAHPGIASAAPEIERNGAQIEGLLGGSSCLPGRAQCRRDNDTLHGITRGSFGGGVAVGWRATRWLLVGATYRYGLFRPDYVTVGLPADYARGSQHTIAAMLRPILPVWRFDLGLNLAPGYSRQTFVYDNGYRDFTQGFAFMAGPVIDVFVTKRFFIGFQADFIFNVHQKVCQRRGSDKICVAGQRDRDLAPVNQAVYGLHLGGTLR